MNKNDTLTSLQYEILDKIYFVESYKQILEEVHSPANIIADEIKNMIVKRWVQVLVYDENIKDYVKTEIYDTDNLQNYFFLITKEGLLKHHGR
jgi:AICAR transformylase/IMP cyclohydrolase PurH